ncbi:MAG TPA: hypothetical protein VJ931_05080, partial [Actinomycetota bacterium]|nr:hypothetical protein [Actinomycetota bacterium]
LAAAGLALVLAASAVAVRVILVEARDQAIYGTQPVALSRVDGLDAAREVGYDLAAYTPVGLYGYQWQLAWARIVLFDSRRDPPPDTEWVVAGLDWPQARQAGGRRVWAHPAYGQALWRLPPPGAGYDSPASPLRGTTSSGRAERRSRREETPPSRTRRRGP